ncbi:putative bidirectional sugar transporter SWEET7e [Orobanche hederae]
MNCMFGIFYGLPIVHSNSTLVVTINGAEVDLEIIYLSIFFYNTIKKNRKSGLWIFLFSAARILQI